jgi:hypothetical protein
MTFNQKKIKFSSKKIKCQIHLFMSSNRKLLDFIDLIQDKNQISKSNLLAQELQDLSMLEITNVQAKCETLRTSKQVQDLYRTIFWINE